MRFDLYQRETEQLALMQSCMLNEAQVKLQRGQNLSLLEQGGVMHALQLLIENAIGKAKHILKAQGETVPVSAYDAFSSIIRLGVLPTDQLKNWNAVIGIRNRIVHVYMNIDMQVIFELLINQRYQFVINFLMQATDLSGKAK
ncbi:MAG: DUF86 domain-containing protein [Methylococcaceae bacterium]|jgi:uncharacterized protein YutE (UPF0331/DUF86 family)